MMAVTVKLSAPIEAHGETLQELTLREPNGKDLRTIGMPYRIGAEDGSITVDAGVVARHISALAGVPLSAVDKMPAGDWGAALSAVLGFFGMAPAGGSTPET